LPIFSQSGITEKPGEIAKTATNIHKISIVPKIHSSPSQREPEAQSRDRKGAEPLQAHPFPYGRGSLNRQLMLAIETEVGKMLFCRFFI
jgi:hypothetical protein